MDGHGYLFFIAVMMWDVSLRSGNSVTGVWRCSVFVSSLIDQCSLLVPSLDFNVLS